MFENYVTLEKGTVYLHREFLEKVNDVERLVFDCDGVLINTNNSYRKTIKQTLSLIFKPFPQRKFIGYKEIEKLKFTGIYNNDWDTTYALALFLFTTLSKEQAKELIEWLKYKHLKTNFKYEKDNFSIEFENFLKSIKLDPVNDPEKYSTKVCHEKGAFNEFKEFIEIIGKPTNAQESFLAKIFDAIYYGEKLFKKIYNIVPPIKILKGNIEIERLYISRRTLSALKMIFDSNMHLLTGRSKISIQHKIKDMEEYFDINNSFFIEDIVRDGIYNINEFKKPSPTPLLKLANNQLTLYIGDSTEDLLLAKKAKEVSKNVFFAGVVKSNDKMTKAYFIESNADLIIHSINKLPKVFKNRM